MPEELLNDGAQEAPVADDLRSTILAAVEQQRAPANDTPPVETQPTDAEKAQRARDEQGRFAPQEKAQEGKDASKQDQQAKAPEAAQEAPAVTDVAVRPPPGWSPKSKAAFDSLPPEVKADIAKREGEVNQGLAKLQDFKGLEPYAERARREGQTLEQAMGNLIQWEDGVRRAPVDTIMVMAKNLGIAPVALANAILERAGGAPANTAIGGQQQPQPQPGMAQIHPALLQEIAQMKNTLAAQEAERIGQQRQATAQNVDAFFADPKNKFADNVSNEMVGLINQARASGKTVSVADLPGIYETACYMNAEVRQLLINERLAPQSASDAAKAATARAQQAAKAVTGAPSRGAAPGNAPPKDEPLRDTIRRAIAEQRAG